MSVRIITGNSLDVLPTMEAASMPCCVTSPPYYGLRDYGVPPNAWPAVEFAPMPGLPMTDIPAQTACLGLETDPQAYIGHMLLIFRELWRVMRDDGVVWVNMGDSYATKPHGSGSTHDPKYAGGRNRAEGGGANRRPIPGVKHKDLMGMPWRLAFALQANGWYLRQDIIWSKPNPMPESVTDRCTKAHEYFFMLTKSERYYFDAEAIKEKANTNTYARRSVKMPDGWDSGKGTHGSFHKEGREKGQRKLAAPGSGGKNNSSMDAAMAVMPEIRNKRSVWTVATEGFKEAHFATFPPELIEPCIKATCPPGGTVLDIFGGAGTVGLVADRLQRNAVLIDIKPEYSVMQENRIIGDSPLFAEVN